MYNTYYSIKVLITLEFSGHIFEKPSSIKLHKNPFQWQPTCSVGTEGQTDEQTR